MRDLSGIAIAPVGRIRMKNTTRSSTRVEPIATRRLNDLPLLLITVKYAVCRRPQCTGLASELSGNSSRRTAQRVRQYHRLAIAAARSVTYFTPAADARA